MPFVKHSDVVPLSMRERFVQCVNCLCDETLFFEGNRMVKTSRFVQDGNGNVYHLCRGVISGLGICKVFPAFK
jgi:hypothetical protein